MENYTKVVLYAYPFLQTAEKDYEDHIRNKAILSFDSSVPAENLAEYIAEEILQKQRLKWLKGVIERAIGKLSDVEKTLVAIRYFGKRRKIHVYRRQNELQSGTRNRGWSERMYFRHQQKLGDKIGGLLKLEGLTADVYERDFQSVEFISKIHNFVQEGRDRKISVGEREWLRIRIKD